MQKSGFVWFIALVCTGIVLLFTFYQNQEKIVACRFSYTYQVNENMAQAQNGKLLLEDPPYEVISVALSYFEKPINHVWTDLFNRGVSGTYYSRKVDEAGALSYGVLVHFLQPYQGCNWVLLKVYPVDTDR